MEDYFYGDEAEQFRFYRVPKLLVHDPKYRQLSTDAKLLYGMMIDRMGLSKQNGWLDKDGRVFIYYSIQAICDDLVCANKKAGRLLMELDEARLIDRSKQGQGKPDLIYVKKFVDNFSEVSKQHFKKCQNNTSRNVKRTRQEVSEQHTKDNKTKDTEFNDINPILSEDEKGVDEYSSYKDYFYDQLEVDILKADYPFRTELIDSIVELIVEVMCSKRKTIRIASDDKPINIVKSRFMKLNSEHIKFVLDRFSETTTKIGNVKQYLLASIFNAPTTIEGYYDSLVRHDMAEGVFYGGQE